MHVRCSKLVECLDVLPEEKRAAVQKGPAMHDVTFRSLELLLHQPYWLCHAGNCEHFFVIEHLRYFDLPLGLSAPVRLT